LSAPQQALISEIQAKGIKDYKFFVAHGIQQTLTGELRQGYEYQRVLEVLCILDGEMAIKRGCRSLSKCYAFITDRMGGAVYYGAYCGLIEGITRG